MATIEVDGDLVSRRSEDAAGKPKVQYLDAKHVFTRASDGHICLISPGDLKGALRVDLTPEELEMANAMSRTKPAPPPPPAPVPSPQAAPEASASKLMKLTKKELVEMLVGGVEAA